MQGSGRIPLGRLTTHDNPLTLNDEIRTKHDHIKQEQTLLTMSFYLVGYGGEMRIKIRYFPPLFAIFPRYGALYSQIWIGLIINEPMNIF